MFLYFKHYYFLVFLCLFNLGHQSLNTIKKFKFCSVGFGLTISSTLHFAISCLNVQGIVIITRNSSFESPTNCGGPYKNKNKKYKLTSAGLPSKRKIKRKNII